MSDTLATIDGYLKTCGGAILTECCDACITVYHTGCLDGSMIAYTGYSLGSRYRQTASYAGAATTSSNKQNCVLYSTTSSATTDITYAKTTVSSSWFYQDVSHTGQYNNTTTLKTRYSIPRSSTGVLSGNFSTATTFSFNSNTRQVDTTHDSTNNYAIVETCRMFSNVTANLDTQPYNVSYDPEGITAFTLCSTGYTRTIAEYLNPEYDAFKDNGAYISGIETYSRSATAHISATGIAGTLTTTKNRLEFAYDHLHTPGTYSQKDIIQFDSSESVIYQNIIIEGCA